METDRPQPGEAATLAPLSLALSEVIGFLNYHANYEQHDEKTTADLSRWIDAVRTARDERDRLLTVGDAARKFLVTESALTFAPHSEAARIDREAAFRRLREAVLLAGLAHSIHATPEKEATDGE